MKPGSRNAFARPLALSALLFAAAGCVEAPLISPAEGGAPWTCVTSPHFVVKTNVDPGEARTMAQGFEGSRAALERAMGWSEPASTERVEVISFANATQFHSLDASADARLAYFSPQLALDIEPQPVLVMYRSEENDDGGHSVFLHELTHRFLRERYREIPTWLNEGLAQFYETFRFDGRRGFVGAPEGRPSAAVLWTDWYAPPRGGLIPMSLIPSATTLAATSWQDFYGDGLSAGAKATWMAAHYAGAFRFVHLLMNGPNADYRSRFQAYLGALARGEKPSIALGNAFTGVDVAAMEKAYEAYLANPRLREREIDLGPPEAPAVTASRPMSDSEVHLLWARLLPSDDESSPFVEREIGKAVRRDPASSEARFRRALWLVKKHRPAEAEGDLAAVLAARPDDPRYLVGRLDAYEAYNPSAFQCGEPSPVVEEAVEHLSRVAVTGAELNLVAWYRESHGQADVGLPFALEAIRRAPLSSSAQDTYSMLLLQRGDLAGALAANERASALLPERSKSRAALLHRRKIDAAREIAAPEAGASAGDAATGHLPARLIQGVISAAAPRLQCCYELGHRWSPTLAGNIDVKASIEPDGSVSGAGIVSSTIPDPAVTSCVQREIAKLRFPAPVGGVATLVAPLSFGPTAPSKLPR
ncbi:MAG: AgmX/PglI C-terminal domain-containing protein [Byssovorax sp.]